MRVAWAAPLVALLPSFLSAQNLVVSPGPETVSVSFYRGGGGEMDLDWLEGYALITETRTLDIPEGAADLRFEGVAGGMIPVSAIVKGLPGSVAEKNRDARLISPGGLVDAMLGQRVHIRRTSRATGKVTEAEAVLRSGPDGVILHTSQGIEALRCTGLPESLVYDRLPDRLTDRPTLSVRTSSPTAVRATVSLSYLATGFDWRANYVVSMAPGGRTLDLFAWLTLANGNDESFVAAQAQAVAGMPNKEDEQDLAQAGVSEGLQLSCWPSGTTSDVPVGLPGSVPPPAYELEGGDDIVVTARRRMEMMQSVPVAINAAMVAGQEDLGDLKLYRIPEPVTVAAHAQKQVAFLTKTGVRFEQLYGADLNLRDEEEPATVGLLLRFRNDKKHGLGMSLPSGSAAIFESVAGRPILAGESVLLDTAVGEEFELRVGQSPQVWISQRKTGEASREWKDGELGIEHYEVEITNANPHPVTVETLLRNDDSEWAVKKSSRKLDQRNGRPMWRSRVPANGRSILAYSVEEKEIRDDEERE